MSNLIIPKTKGLIIDACVLINIHSSGNPTNILNSLPYDLYISDHTYHEIRSFSPLIYIIPKIVTHVDIISDEEFLIFLNLANTGLGNGESSSAAIAIHNNFSMSTDDFRATEIIKTYKDIELVSTIRILHHWIAYTNPSPADIKSVLRSIRDQGDYEPRSHHPEYSWWMNTIR